MKNLIKYLNSLGKTDSDLADLLGGEHIIAQFGKFYDKHFKILSVITAVKLNEFNVNNEYDSKEHTAYMKGLSELINIFVQCSDMLLAEDNKTSSED